MKLLRASQPASQHSISLHKYQELLALGLRSSRAYLRCVINLKCLNFYSNVAAVRKAVA